MRIHPPVLLLAFVIASLMIGRLEFLTLSHDAVQWLGVALAVIGLVPAALAVREFRVAGTTLDPRGPVRALVTSGPYRYSRNPIYLGYVLAEAGLPLALGSVWGLLLAPAFMLALTVLVIRPEEQYLARTFAAEYRRFRAGVRRWL